jgi:cyanophycinase
MTQPKGTLIIIGGHEERARERERAILAEVAGRANGSKPLVVVTVASGTHAESGDDYVRVFRELGVDHPRVLPLRSRQEAEDERVVQQLAEAAVVFFTGGDQLRITSQLGDSPVYRCLHELYRRGATIAGTSAGAAAMSETMVVGGAGDASPGISALRMAPGLGLLGGVVVDSHFAERGRFGRLLGAVAQNPANLGLGLDEDTAVVVERGQRFRVLGSGAAYVFDGSTIRYSSLSEARPEGVLTIHGVTLHVLGSGDAFDLEGRRPCSPGPDAPPDEAP